MYINEAVNKYLNDLAAKQPTPGGGSAAALAGALGSALLEMVCNFTIGNKKYKDIEGIAADCLISAKGIREKFLLLVDEDTKIYSSICAAFKTKDEKIIDNALKEGYYISLKMCELAKAGMTIALNLAEKSNVNLITDVGCGTELLKACFNSARAFLDLIAFFIVVVASFCFTLSIISFLALRFLTAFCNVVAAF